jgi:hypothetical protein
MSVHTANSKMSEGRREKLLNIQKKEQLKGLLINKFKLKYGDNAEKLISNEVTKFLKNDRLTEGNLVKLDEKIGKANQKNHKADDILSEHRSQKSDAGMRKSKASRMSNASRPHTVASGAPRRSNAKQNGDLEDAMSVKSYASSRMSGATNLSKKSKQDVGGAHDEAHDGNMDELMSVQSRTKSSYSKLNEEDEWQAIQNFNIMLHYEEQKQTALREQERKRLIKEELDRQCREKNKKKKREQLEEKEYEQVQQQHLKLLETKEQQRVREAHQKVENEKRSRDQQMQEEKLRKRMSEKQEYEQEKQVVKRLHSEMDEERKQVMEKRRQEKEYLQIMLQENEQQKKRQLNDQDREKQEDVEAQEAYNIMLEQQENDRIREVEERERRAQEFMGRMADTVIKNMDAKQREEEEKIRQYEMDKENSDRRHDDRAQKRREIEKSRMREFLARQVEDKKKKEYIEKELNDEQATMWRKDRENYEQEEKRINDKVKKINKENAEFLTRQVGEKDEAKKGKMDMNEYLLNRQLLKGINEQRKVGSSDASVRSDRY